MVTALILLVAEAFTFAASPEKLFEQLAKQVVVIETRDEWHRSLSQGSGVVLGQSLCNNQIGTDILTNFHVIALASEITVLSVPSDFDAGGKAKIERFDSAVVYFDDDKDLAIIRTLKPLTCTPISTATACKIGQKVYALGAPMGFGWTFSDGILSGIRDDKERTMLQTTVPVSPGSSGGGLFDENGQLLALITSQIKDAQNINFGIQIQESGIKEFSILRKGVASPLTLLSSTFDWQVGIFKSPSPPYTDIPLNWRDSNKKWQKFTVLMELEEATAKRLKEVLSKGEKPASELARLNQQDAEVFRVFPRYTKGLSSAFHEERDSDKKQALLQGLPDYEKNNFDVFWTLSFDNIADAYDPLRYPGAHLRSSNISKACDAIKEFIARLPDLSKDDADLTLYKDSLTHKQSLFRLRIHLEFIQSEIDRYGDAEAKQKMAVIRSMLKEKGWDLEKAPEKFPVYFDPTQLVPIEGNDRKR